MIKIICVGKIKEQYLRSAISEYEKRLKKFTKLEIIEVNDESNGNILEKDINLAIGLELEKECGVSYLVSDFKKNDGYKKSILFSKEYNLYRQDYCGCVYSKKERDERVSQKD